MTTELKRSDFSKICRTCLLQKDNMEPIYKSDIPKMLLSFTNIKVDSEDDLPKLICSDCSDQVAKCYLFKETTQQNEGILIQILKDNTNPHKNVPHSGEDPNEIKTEFRPKREDDLSDRNKDCVTAVDSDDGVEEDRQSLTEDALEEESAAFECKFCRASFKHKYNITRHVLNYHSGTARKKEVCDICGKSVWNIYNHKNYVHASRRDFPCMECNKMYPIKSQLTQHIRTFHRRENRAARLCPLCGKIIASIKAYEYHMRVHSGEKPYTCDLCAQSFTGRGHLRKHQSIHTGERPYHCPHCDKKFRHKNVLTAHVRTHTGERPFVCGICSRAFTQKINLKTHMKVHAYTPSNKTAGKIS